MITKNEDGFVLIHRGANKPFWFSQSALVLAGNLAHIGSALSEEDKHFICSTSQVVSSGQQWILSSQQTACWNKPDMMQLQEGHADLSFFWNGTVNYRYMDFPKVSSCTFGMGQHAHFPSWFSQHVVSSGHSDTPSLHRTVLILSVAT